MAKAILGHVGGPDPRMISEMRRLQRRVRDLEAELARLQEENDVLSAGVGHELFVAGRVREPARTRLWRNFKRPRTPLSGGPGRRMSPRRGCSPAPGTGRIGQDGRCHALGGGDGSAGHCIAYGA
jgi:hypothetical protein